MILAAALASPALAQSPPPAGPTSPPSPHPPPHPAPAPRRPAGPPLQAIERQTSEELFQGAPGQVFEGIEIHSALIMDASVGIKGGVDSDGTAFRNLFDLNIAFDLEHFFGLTGGTFFLDFQNQDGEDGSLEIAGDIQAFSNIDEDSFTQLAQLWYEQTLFNKRVRLKIGKVDANTEFAGNEHGLAFLNSSAAYSPTIYLFPTYPDPAMSINLFWYPDDSSYLGFGMYDGALAEGVPTGQRGPGTFFDDPGDWFWILETGFSWGGDGTRMPGRLAGGAWLNNGDQFRFDGEQEDEAFGFYATFEQTLWQVDPSNPEDPRGTGLFLQYGWADEDVSEIAHHVGGGVAVTGPLPGRDHDVAGLGATWVKLSDHPDAGFVEDSELAIETFYRIQVTPLVRVQPDLQYIFNPGGTGLPNSFVFTLRVEVGF